MSNVIDFIEECKVNGAKSVILKPDLNDILTDVKSEIGTMAPAQKDEARDVLREIMTCLDEHISELKGNAKETKSNMARVKANSEACIAYLDSARKGTPDRKKK